MRGATSGASLFFVDPLEGAEQSRDRCQHFLAERSGAIACGHCQHSMRERWDALPAVTLQLALDAAQDADYVL